MVVVPAPVARTPSAEQRGPLQALIVDRQPLFVDALGSLLAGPPLCAVVRAANRADRALEIVQRDGVQVVFCDVGADPTSSRELAEALGALDPPVPTILLGDEDEFDRLAAALAAGVAGVFTKDSSFDEFIVGVDTVLSGHRAVGDSLMTHLIARSTQSTSKHARSAGAGQLSPTELEILAMIGGAESIPAIAASRGISHKTVRNHLAKIYRKLELHGRTEAMLWAARMGLTGTLGQ
ncbi:MAG TPA: response regulator transcription factor [Candidatus Dormibacteraeota bacterium]|nr:response regulator transcription factor [Candidatus Dormibacteraeota bacterium]